MKRHPWVILGVGLPMGYALAAYGLSRATMIVIGACLGLLYGSWLNGVTIRSLARRWHEWKSPPQAAVPKKYISPYTVTFDDQRISVAFQQKREEVRWDDLVMVIVKIEDGFLPIPYWILMGRPGKGGCVYENSAPGAGEMLRELQNRLPGFDNRALGHVMMMDTGGMKVWEHPDWKTEDAPLETAAKMMKVLKFLDRYLLRALSGLACVLGLAGSIIGYFAGIQRHECTVLAVVSGIAGLLAFVPRSDSFHLVPRKKRSREPYVSPYTVQFDDETITVALKNKKRESVRWADLAIVGITIADTYLPEPYWVLAGMPGTGGCIYANDAIGARELLSALQERLSGFDNVALIQAMGMMSGGVRIWERKDWKSIQQARPRVVRDS